VDGKTPVTTAYYIQTDKKNRKDNKKITSTAFFFVITVHIFPAIVELSILVRLEIPANSQLNDTLSLRKSRESGSKFFLANLTIAMQAGAKAADC
jgi:hypothetical protein